MPYAPTKKSWIPGRATPDFDPGLPEMTPELFQRIFGNRTLEVNSDT